MEKNKVDKLIEKNNAICEKIYIGEESKAFKEISELINNNNEVFTEIISLIPKLNKIGIEIPAEVIIQQLRNLLTACEKRDSILLIDTLKYEINDTLSVYLDIMEELEKENIVI